MSEILKQALLQIPPPSPELSEKIVQRLCTMRKLEKEFHRTTRREIIGRSIFFLLLAGLPMVLGSIPTFQYLGKSLWLRLSPVINTWESGFQSFNERFKDMILKIEFYMGYLQNLTPLHILSLVVILVIAALITLYRSAEPDFSKSQDL